MLNRPGTATRRQKPNIGDLAARQHDVLHILYQHHLNRLPQPTCREMAGLMGLSQGSIQFPHQCIRALAKKGYVEILPGARSRYWKLTQKAIETMEKEGHHMSREGIVRELMRLVSCCPGAAMKEELLDLARAVKGDLFEAV